MPRIRLAATAVLLVVAAGCTAAAPPASPAPTAEPAPTPQPPTASPGPATPPRSTTTPAVGTLAPAPDTPAGGAASVSAVDFSFNPNALTVDVGTQVIWTNNGAVPHTVTFADDGPDSGVLDSGQTFQFAFTEAGTFNYVCTIHSGMTGTITVSD